MDSTNGGGGGGGILNKGDTGLDWDVDVDRLMDCK